MRFEVKLKQHILANYNTERTYQGKMCCGRTPEETLLDGKEVWASKNLAQI